MAQESVSSESAKKQRINETKEQKKQEGEREQMKAKREEFTKRLTAIRDEKKKAVVERIDTKIATINKNRTDKMAKHLEKMSSILSRLQERLNAAKSLGKDTAAFETALIDASSAIVTSQTAVVQQAAKQYTASITDETTLRTTVGSVVSQLQSDLQTTMQTVVDAKQKLQNTLKEGKKITS